MPITSRHDAADKEVWLRGVLNAFDDEAYESSFAYSEEYWSRMKLH